MKKSYELSKKILNNIEKYTSEYTTTEGKIITTNESIILLDKIIKDGLVLYQRICDKKIYTDKPDMCSILNDLNKNIEALQKTDINYNKLNLASALQLWEQTKVIIAMLACNVMDYYEGLN